MLELQHPPQSKLWGTKQWEKKNNLTLHHCPVCISAWSSNNWWTEHKAKTSLLKNTHFSSNSKISRSSEAASKRPGAPERPIRITAAASSQALLSACLYFCLSDVTHESRAPWAFTLIGRLQKDIDGGLQPTQWDLSTSDLPVTLVRCQHHDSSV